MVAQMMMMDDFVQNLLRDRKACYDDDDLNSSVSTIHSEQFVLISDNARVFADSVPKAAFSNLQQPSGSNMEEQTHQQGSDRWGTNSPTNSNPNQINNSISNNKDRWGTNSDSGMTMPQRKCVSPYRKAVAFCPSFEMSRLDLSIGSSIFSLEENADDDDDDSSCYSSSTVYSDSESEFEIGLDALTLDGRGTKTED